MSNSSLISYTKLSPNCTKPRKYKIDTVSIHCMAGNLSVETCGEVFQNTERDASSNYGIGSDGRIALYVDEENRSWCTSSGANDHRAITIEVANNGGASAGWPVSEAAFEALILLLTDICKRNEIKNLLWKANKSLIGQVDEQNMTVHRWFANKACPGDYLYNRHDEIARRVNENLEEDEDMDIGKLTDEQIDELWARIRARLGEKEVSDYAKRASEKGIKKGVFADGDRDGLVDDPLAPVLRQELVVTYDRLGLLD